MYRIVQMVPALGWGGAQVFCIQLCNELAKYNNYQVTLISMYNYDEKKHLPLSMLSKHVKFICLGKKPGIDVKMFSKIYQTLKQIKPDVVHTHLHAGYYCFYSYFKLKYPFKKVHTLHNLARQDAPPHGRMLFKYFFKRHIIEAVTISDEVHKSALQEYGSYIKTLIYNGSDEVKPTSMLEDTKRKISSLKKNNATKVLLNVARISKQKNQKLLVDVMHELKDENVIAIILGDYVPDDKPVYDELVSNKPSNVFLLGKVSNVSDYLLNADAFVLTSIFEGLPISLLEALSAGAIPVCTAVGGLKSIVKKDVGFLSNDVTKDSFLKTLNEYLHTSQECIEALKKNGKALYNKDFSMQTCAAKYNALYHSAF